MKPLTVPGSQDRGLVLNVVGPYDLALSLRTIRSFQPAAPESGDRMRLTASIDGNPTLIEVRQNRGPDGRVTAFSKPKAGDDQIRYIAEWVIFAELDLTPFYRLVDEDPKISLIARQFYGLKPTRPVSLFEMAVVAITEQQISLAAAYTIRSRLIQRFGTPVDSQWIFPEPDVLSRASIEELRSCGLSRQKAQYILELATALAGGTLDLDVLKTMDDDKAREMLMDLRGFGRWSADYFLVRGLARPDCIPVDDLAVRSVIGKFLGEGPRLSPVEVTAKLERFRPYRGLLAFYLLVAHRLKPAVNA